MFGLKVEKRERKGKAVRKLRKEGLMPAVFYGAKERSTPILVSEHDFTKLWREAGESSVIELEGVGDTKEVLIQDVDVDPVSGAPRHADFYVIEKGKKVTVSVPLEFIGEAPAVAVLGGTLVKVLHELEIEVMPKDLPHDIKVDVSGLKDFDTQVHVKDLPLPESAEATADSDEVVALVAEAKEEEEEEPAEAPDLDSIEVEQKGKGEEGEEGGAPAETKEEPKEAEPR